MGGEVVNEFGPIVFVTRASWRDRAVQGVQRFGSPTSSNAYRGLFDGLETAGIAEEKVADPAFLSELVQDRLRAGIGSANIDESMLFHRPQHGFSIKRNLGKGKAHRGRRSIEAGGGSAKNRHRVDASRQNLQRGLPQREEVRQKDAVVVHLPNLEPPFGWVELAGQKGFTDEIKINQAEEEPADQLIQLAISLFILPLKMSHVAKLEPAGFYRVNHGYAAYRLTPREDSIQAGKVVLHDGIFLEPRRLVSDGRWVIALGFPLHREPVQVMHSKGDAECGLPIALPLMASKVEVPVGHSVEFARHALPPALADCTLALLGGEELVPVAEHVNPRNLKTSIGAHGFPDRTGLFHERRFLHHVAGQADSMGRAPLANRIGERRVEPLGHVIDIAVTKRVYRIPKIPEEFGQALPKWLLECLRDVDGKGDACVEVLIGRVEVPEIGNLGLVGKDRWDALSKIRPKPLPIPFMSYL